MASDCDSDLPVRWRICRRVYYFRPFGRAVLSGMDASDVGGEVFIAFCVLAELSRLKCPHCRSRAVALMTADEVDRWIGQKIVDEDTIGIGGFQTFGESKFRGVAGSVAVTRRTIPVTKRCVLENYRCEACGRDFKRKVVEEMR
jgi:DNA-directed RNA polymerase subunit RPC12/RpoP